MYPNYPNQPGGYPSQNPGFGFGFNNESNYPQGGGAPYPQGGAPYPQGGNIGFPTPGFNDQPAYGGNGYPPQPGYPGQPAYPSQPGFPSQQYPPQQPSYPGQQPGFPPSSSNYPPSQQQGFPPGASNYPPSQPDGYPPSSSNYPPYQPPASSAGSGYPPYQPPGAAGSNNSSYPPYQPPAGQPGGAYPAPYQPAPTNPAAQYPGSTPGQNPHLYPNLGGAGNSPVMNPASSFTSQNYIVACEGTLKPHQPFNANDDAGKLYKAMKGFGTDETTLIDVLCKRTSKQRQEIILSYKTCYGKDLLKNIKDELSGNFELLFKSLLATPAQLEAHDLKKAIDGAGTDEVSLIDILCTKTNAEMAELKIAFKQMYNKDLEKTVGGDVSGYFKRLLVSLTAANRSDSPPNHERAVVQAKELYQAGEKRIGTNEVEFNRIFASESFPHLKLVFEEYYKQTGHDIDKAIKSEMSGDVERAFLAVVETARNPPAYYARRLYESMKGAGTFDRALVRNIVLRSERDMVQIKQEFQRRYGKTLESFIKGDCSGDYKRALLCLVGDPSWK